MTAENREPENESNVSNRNLLLRAKIDLDALLTTSLHR